MVISLASFANALDFSLEAPPQVHIGEEFNVTISAETQDTYDVKIFVYIGELTSRPNYVSEIYDEADWRNPHNYVVGVYPARKTFQLRVSEYEGAAELCARLRRTGATSYSQTCLPIESSQSAASTINNQSNKNATGEPPNQSIAQQNLSEKPSFVPANWAPTIEQPVLQPEKIVLNSNVNISSTKPIYRGAEAILRKWMFIGFALFSLTLVILISLRRHF